MEVEKVQMVVKSFLGLKVEKVQRVVKSFLKVGLFRGVVKRFLGLEDLVEVELKDLVVVDLVYQVEVHLQMVAVDLVFLVKVQVDFEEVHEVEDFEEVHEVEDFEEVHEVEDWVVVVKGVEDWVVVVKGVEDWEVDWEVVVKGVEDWVVVGTVASHNFVNMRLDKVLHRKVLVVSLSTGRIDTQWFHKFQYTC